MNIGDEGQSFNIPANSFKQEQLKLIGDSSEDKKKKLLVQVFSGNDNDIPEFVNGRRDDVQVELRGDGDGDDGPREQKLFIGYNGEYI